VSRIIGIDPGVRGGIALLVDGVLRDVDDLPTQAGGSTTSGRQLAEILRTWQPELIVVEAVHCNGLNGSKANWSLGHSKGVIEGVIESLRHPLAMMSPQEWKKLNGLTGKTKDDSRQLAQALWPDHYDSFKRKRDDGRAEAALIARALIIRNVRQHYEQEDQPDAS
jgi:crossover junction endodeoxyribonuclease RuvC